MLQKRATKLVSKIKHLPYKVRLSKKGLPHWYSGDYMVTWSRYGIQDTLRHLW